MKFSKTIKFLLCFCAFAQAAPIATWAARCPLERRSTIKVPENALAGAVRSDGVTAYVTEWAKGQINRGYQLVVGSHKISLPFPPATNVFDPVLKWTKDGKLLLSAANFPCHLVDAETGEVVQANPNGFGEIYDRVARYVRTDLSVSPNENWFVAREAGYKAIRIESLRRPTQIKRPVLIHRQEGIVSEIRSKDSGSIIATAVSNQGLSAIVKFGPPSRSGEGGGRVSIELFDQDGNAFGKAIEFGIADSHSSSIVPWVPFIEFSPNGKHLAWGTSDGAVYVAHVKTGRFNKLAQREALVTGLSFFDRGSRLQAFWEQGQFSNSPARLEVWNSSDLP